MVLVSNNSWRSRCRVLCDSSTRNISGPKPIGVALVHFCGGIEETWAKIGQQKRKSSIESNFPALTLFIVLGFINLCPWAGFTSLRYAQVPQTQKRKEDDVWHEGGKCGAQGA